MLIPLKVGDWKSVTVPRPPEIRAYLVKPASERVLTRADVYVSLWAEYRDFAEDDQGRLVALFDVGLTDRQGEPDRQPESEHERRRPAVDRLLCQPRFATVVDELVVDQRATRPGICLRWSRSRTAMDSRLDTPG